MWGLKSVLCRRHVKSIMAAACCTCETVACLLLQDAWQAPQSRTAT